MSSKKLLFRPVEANPNFPEMEKKLLDKWYKDGIVDKYLHKNDNSEKSFSFLDGPITANNPMGVHHAWGRTYKDLWQRYFNMKGYKQRFQNGFDAQGLWVEVEVEKELGFKSKKDIEKYGVAKFVEMCKDRVRKYSDIQTEQSKRLGYFMDWDHSYFTMSDENNYMIWHFLKVVNDNGWLYKGADSVPWCPRCETAISQHEMLTEDYKDTVHKSIFFELPINNRKDEYLLVWTTTPWTLPANIAVAVDRKLDYSLAVGKSGDKFWLATEALERIFGKDVKVIKQVKGLELIGLKYKWAFDHLPAVKKAAKESPLFHTVIPTDDQIMPITTSEGTGMVHTAVSAGSEDFRLGQKLGLPMIPVIDDQANYIEGLGEFTGKNAKKHPEVILDFLINEDKKDGVNWVFNIENYKHRYPACWRCKTELVWKVTDEWYISMDVPSKITKVQLPISKGKTENQNLKTDTRTLRERMIDVAKQIEWIPEFGLKRELDWLTNMHDWLISKKNRYWGLALPIWECSKCGEFQVIGSKGELREKAVKGWDELEGKSPHKPQIDKIEVKCDKCGSNAKRIEPVGNPWLDAGIVAYSTVKKNNQGDPLYLTDKDEWKKWVPATWITESFPGQFKNWFYSLIAMSTVLEDIPPAKRILGFATLLAEDGRPMHKSWGNSIEFNEGADRIGVDVMRWMYVKQNYDQNLLFGYNIADQTRRQFHLTLWNIYRFFVTYANIDEWKPNKGETKLSELDQWIETRLGQVINDVDRSLTGYQVEYASAAIEEFVVKDLSQWYVRRCRDRVGPSAKGETDKNNFYTTLYNVLLAISKLLAPLTPFIADEIFTNLTDETSVHLTGWPEAEYKIDSKLIKMMKYAREVVEKAHSQRKEKGVPVRQPLNSLASTTPIELSDEICRLVRDEINVLDHKNTKGVVSADLDFKTSSKKLAEMGAAREIIRSIQNERKNLGTDLAEYVNATLPSWPETHEEEIKNKSLVRNLTKGDFRVERIS
jgi:isoleucyl-tRNA synthetase